MDCIKQRDEGVGGGRGEGGRGGRRGWAALGRLPAGEQPAAMADRRAERLLFSPLLSSPAKFFVESKFDFRITLIFLEEEEEEEEERGGWISGKIKGWIGLNRDEFGFRQASFRERMLAFEVKERKRGRYVRCV